MAHMGTFPDLRIEVLRHTPCLFRGFRQGDPAKALKIVLGNRNTFVGNVLTLYTRSRRPLE